MTATYPLTFLALSSLLHAMMTCAPNTASPLAVSYPIPVLPPVTTATLPLWSVSGYDKRAPILCISRQSATNACVLTYRYLSIIVCIASSQRPFTFPRMDHVLAHATLRTAHTFQCTCFAVVIVYTSNALSEKIVCKCPSSHDT